MIADILKLTMHYTFRLDNLGGLSNFLVGENGLSIAINCTNVENWLSWLWPDPAESGRITRFEKMKVILKEAKQMYDFV